ncbi:helix-turn-helix domain-containing protein [Nocardiopsis mangrovi]|uniref:Helix-turn-helix domain-containing protein n=1 Tax=Nocardiopsis mangrovi TaxID=1179818 RepID=A0ABV9E6E7_9ACTN
MADTKGSTAARRFGRELSRLRKGRELTQDALARLIGDVSASHLSNLERGYREPTPGLVARLDAAMRLGDHFARTWDDVSGSGRQAWLEEVSVLLRQAAALYDYQGFVFPGYLQTDAYARTIIRAGAPWLSAEQVEDKVNERRADADAILATESPSLWAVVDGTVLDRRYGSAKIMLEQLTHVADLVERDRLHLQVLPPASARHPGVSGSFIVIGGNPDAVYAESIHEGQIVTSAEGVARYRMLYGALQAAALDHDTTATMLRDEMRKLEHE